MTAQDITDSLRGLLGSVENALSGEALRAIGYGAGVVVFLVANASGRFRDVSFEDAVILSGSAATTLITVVESARRYVFSANSVIAVAEDADIGGADAALEAAGLGDTT